jgi:cytochrome P450/ferredoxin-NADP reductase
MIDKASNAELPASAAAKCPFPSSGEVAPNGCPVSMEAAAFDPFGQDYLLDPAEYLRWSRESEPVFYSPKIGYWVVTRYEDVRAIFRDNVTFSPAVALEKIMPVIEEAQEVLRGYDYGMSRTLVNEDEPAHMERRRALMHSFNPEQLVGLEPKARALARSYVDAFIDKGEVDLVDAMLWELPLSVALQFLGVSEEDMDKLREYSIAHTVNTWGRPTPEQQVEIAHKVGKFWKLAGRVLQKMRETPEGEGWMRYAIRQQRELPSVVTDSYLHSMMMAIIVAAHETTAHASANAILTLLRNRALWEELCANPALIPNAVEECLRTAGSVVAWRRITTREAVVGGVTIPEGERLLIVSASANQDPGHFDHANSFDLYRDNAVDHLTFGYGSHQCMGKNIARMEMRVILEELTRRLPHMELAPDQNFTYLPNTSFRGPEHLRVRWDPAMNPERLTGKRSEPAFAFAIGAPSRQEFARSVEVVAMRPEADGVVSLTLRAKSSVSALPAWEPGAHIDVLIGDMVRKYSLCGAPSDGTWQIAVLREAEGRGGSIFIHDQLAPGAELRVRGPKNHFRLMPDVGEHFILVAGGIGVTPIIAMADRLKLCGKSYEIHYCGRSRRAMSFLDRLELDHGAVLTLYPADEGHRLDVGALVDGLKDTDQIYGCGPERLLTALEAAMTGRPRQLHFEHFTPPSARLSPNDELAFEVELRDSQLTITVRPDQTLLDAVRAVGVDVQSDCEEGLCGTCQVALLEGEVEHRDRVLTLTERAAGDRMIACCSRGRGRLVLGL